MRRRQLFWTLAALSALPLLGCGAKKFKAQPLSSEATVLILGDSLTSGVGAADGQDFPSLLAQATRWDVINAGVSGNTSAQALQRLEPLLQEHQPELVIVSIGGNDFLRRFSEAEAKSNIRAICQQAQASGAQVVLVAVPALSLMAAAGVLRDHALYKELADELKIPLLTNAWSRVLAEEKWRADQVHANAQGYAEFHSDLLKALREWGFGT